VNVNGNGNVNGNFSSSPRKSGGGDNWRDRGTPGGGGGSIRSAVRTVGGFAKPGSGEAVSPGGLKSGRKDVGRGSSGVVVGGGGDEEGDEGDSKGE
jgi:hypothetical protein